MSDLFPDALPDLAAQIAEVRREIAQRERVYPRWVASGQMKQATADRQMAVMRAVLNTLTSLHDQERRQAAYDQERRADIQRMIGDPEYAQEVARRVDALTRRILKDAAP